MVPFKVDVKLISEDSEILELFNEYFQVFTTEKVGSIAQIELQLVAEETIHDLNEIDSELELKYLKKIRSNKARDPDEPHARILRECEEELAVPLAEIFTKSMAETKIPLDWKRANVVPIH